jgi:TonB family protein
MVPVDREDDALMQVPRPAVALLAALFVHGLVTAVAVLLPEPKMPEERIEFSLGSPPPPPPAEPVPQAPEPTPQMPQPPEPKQRPTPQPTPVAPSLPTSDRPPSEAVRVPEAEPQPVPAPAPESWKERLMDSLGKTTPRRASGPLVPSNAAVSRIASDDVRLRDEVVERELMEDHGPFFQRGIEALRRSWKPMDVLRKGDAFDPTRLCGRETRTTFAVATIDREGNVLDVEVRMPSGCEPLDAEAVETFKRVARFPFPPKGLFIKPDGSPAATARYPVRFIVSFDGRSWLDWR